MDDRQKKEYRLEREKELFEMAMRNWRPGNANRSGH